MTRHTSDAGRLETECEQLRAMTSEPETPEQETSDRGWGSVPSLDLSHTRCLRALPAGRQPDESRPCTRAPPVRWLLVVPCWSCQHTNSATKRYSKHCIRHASYLYKSSVDGAG